MRTCSLTSTASEYVTIDNTPIEKSVHNSTLILRGQNHPGDLLSSIRGTSSNGQISDMNFTRIKHRQESVVIKHIADGPAPTAWDALEVLVTDGGKVSPKDIAEEAGRHPGSVRRTLDRIPELVEREYGSVSLRSKYIADLVHDAVKEAEEATRRAAEAGAKAIEIAERGVDKSTSAFIAWATKVQHQRARPPRRTAQTRLRQGRRHS